MTDWSGRLLYVVLRSKHRPTVHGNRTPPQKPFVNRTTTLLIIWLTYGQSFTNSNKHFNKALHIPLGLSHKRCQHCIVCKVHLNQARSILHALQHTCTRHLPVPPSSVLSYSLINFQHWSYPCTWIKFH
jgi:hypothetical protein